MADTLNLAAKVQKNGVKRLAVVEGDNKPVGFIADRELKRASASDAIFPEVQGRLPVPDLVGPSKVKTKSPVTAGAGTTIQSTAKVA